MYAAIKHAHLAIIALTFIIFLINFVLTLKQSDGVNNKLLKIGPHILYTLFIITFIYMVGYRMSEDLPLSHTWALSKLGGFVFYVLSIALALKWAKKTLWRVVGLISAVFWLFMSARLGFAKNLMVKVADTANAYIESAQQIIASLV
jgi:uncharacterized membrane protein SirB2